MTMFPIAARAAALALGIVLLLSTSLAGAGPVNINTADAATLSRELKGIGAKRAQAIVDYRKAHGPFKSADELALVKGIGPAAIDRNRADIRVDAGRSQVCPRSMWRHCQIEYYGQITKVDPQVSRWPDAQRMQLFAQQCFRWPDAERVSFRPPRPVPRRCCRSSTSR